MIERLVEALAAMEPEPSAEELADALWLARFLDPPDGRPGGGNGAGAEAGGAGTGVRYGADLVEFAPGNGVVREDAAESGLESNGLAHGVPAAAGTAIGAGNGAAGPGAGGPSGPSSASGSGGLGDAGGPVPQAGLYLPGGLTGDDAAAAYPVRSPTLPALPHTLKLARALRPLRLETPAPLPGRLNEERTARRLAESGIWDPQLDPAVERRFDLVLVVDVAASMTVWRHTADELRLLLERLGAFRDVRIRYLDTDGITEPEGPPGAEGRRVVLVVSDCIGAAWQDGRAAALLERWGRAGAVAVVQPLPQRLWRRCAAATEQVFLRAPAPGAANIRLAVRTRDRAGGAAVPPGVAVPVLELDRRWLAPWAAMIAGSGREIAGEALFTGRPVAERPPPPPDADAGEEPGALERVLRFRASASPEAFELAGYLAAAPLRLPVMRLVQRAMLPGSTPAHLAEVFLGGLMRVADGEPAGHSGVAYEFHDGVRDVLLGGLRRDEALLVLREVWGTVRDRLGSSLDFPALLAAVREGADVLPPDQPFAQVAARVLARLGGSYGAVARRLTAAAAAQQAHGLSGDDENGSARRQEPRAPAEREGPSVLGDVPPRSPRFQRRDDLMARVRAALRDTGVAVLLPEEGGPAAGTGRTGLAVELARARLQEYDLVWWIPAADTRSVRVSLGELARRLGTPLSDDLAVTVANVLRVLRGGLPGGRWLLVYDGACGPADLAPLMPSDPGGTAAEDSPGDVLVTSGDRGWARVAAGIEVGALARSESVALLRHGVPSLTAAEAGRLAERCGDLPGALVQAAVWLSVAAEHGASGDVEDHVRLLDERARARPELDPYAAALAATLDGLRARHPVAADLLALWSELGPGPVPADMLGVPGMLGEIVADEDALLTAMRTLECCEVAVLDPDARSLRVSPAVQAVLRDGLPAAARARIRARVREMLIAATPRSGPEDRTTWQVRALITPHVLPSGAVGAGTEARRLVVDQARFLLLSGDHEACRALAGEAVARWRARYGDGDALMLDAACVLTRALRNLGRAEEAAAAGDDLVRGMRARLGRDDPGVALAAGRLGTTGPRLRSEGDLVAAYEHDEDFWKRMERRYGPDHPETLRAAGAVAGGLCLLGRFHEAYDLDTMTLGRLRAGGDDGAVLEGATRLGRDLHGLGRYGEALRVQKAALDGVPELLGRDHVLVLRAQTAHAGTLRKTGRPADAARLAAVALDGHLRRFGPDHPSTLAARATAALARAAAGSPGPGRVLAEEALAGCRRALGEDHPLTGACAVDLGILLRAVGDVRAAFDIDRAALAVLRGGGPTGPDHYYALCGAAGMAHDLYLLGELGAARDAAERALDGFRTRHGPSHPYALACAHNLEIIGRAAGGGRVGPAGPGHQAGRAGDALAGLLGEHHPEVRAAARGDLLDCDIELPPL
ncbi:FxSxx-COOH system tetratricopeptide repeat protein [Spirillospora sp. CA-255316]